MTQSCVYEKMADEALMLAREELDAARKGDLLGVAEANLAAARAISRARAINRAWRKRDA